MRMLLKVLSISTFLYFGSYVAADDMQLDLSTELRLAESATINKNTIGLGITPQHYFELLFDRTNKDARSDKDQFGLSYQWAASERSEIDVKISTTRTEDEGSSPATFGFGFTYRLPMERYRSTIQLGFQNAESFDTQAEAKLNIVKPFDRKHKIPYSLSGSLKLRQREPISGESISAVGGNVSIGVQLFNDLVMKVAHNVEDDITVEGTSVSGVFSKILGGNRYSFSFGATDKDVFHFGLSTAFAAR